MSEPAVIIKIHGLKCDAVGCDFSDENAAPDETSLNRPCPKCGANLLTEADLANVRLLQYIAHSVNAEMGPSQDGCKRETIRCVMDGTGAMKLQHEDNPDADR